MRTMTDADDVIRRWWTLMLTQIFRRGFGISEAIDDFRNSEKCQLSLTSRDEKNMTSYVVGGSVFPKRLSTENILQPTRSLYDVWLKSYGSLCVFHVWGDLDLDLRPFKVIIYVWGQHIPISVNKQILKIFCVWIFVIWLYLKKNNVPSVWPWPMTYEGQLFFVNWLSGYKCPV